MARKTLILLAAAFLVWRIATVSMSSHYAERIVAGDPEAATKALAWDPRQPRALYERALSLRDQDPAKASALLAAAYAANPADVRPLIAAAGMALRAGDAARADALVQTALALAPADPRVLTEAARYWIARGDLGLALRHWSRAVEIDPGRRKELFAVLIDLAEDPRTLPAFEPFAKSPPSWWEAFFEELALRASATDSVQSFFGLRQRSAENPITEKERRAYVGRLLQDGLVAQAYIAWVNGLTQAQREEVALLYDGGFELESDDFGFGWHLGGGRGVLVKRSHTYGSEGERALHVLFQGARRGFLGVSQTLFLEPGRYRVTGRIRTDDLATQGGLSWVVRCRLPESRDLGASERFLGTNPWRDFGFDVEVPADCSLAEIRLVSVGERSFEQEITGSAWFDRMAIRKG